MTKFTNKQELAKAFGTHIHKALETRSLDFEIEQAYQSITFVHKDYCSLTTDLPEELSAYYITGFGYCPA